MPVTSKLRFAQDVALDPDVAGGWTFGVLAKKGAGKTYTGRVMAEEMIAAGIPIVALDPTGAWWGLRSGAKGTKLGGLQVVIFGGRHGDVPLEPTAGVVMADLAIEKRVSMVLDLSEFGTRTAERRFAKDFLDRLYRRNSELMHLFVDEADLFAPQKPQPGDMPLLGTMENIVRRGRLKGIGCTMITQRPAVLNKDVLTQIDTLVLLRIVGPQDRAAIRQWVDGHGEPEKMREVLESLASLQNGESWWWAPEIDLFKHTQVRLARTYDSSPTPRRSSGADRAPAKLVDIDLGAIRDQIAETIERAEADDPKVLRARIADLERELAVAAVEPVVEYVDRPVPMVTTELRQKIVAEITTILTDAGVEQTGYHARVCTCPPLAADLPAGARVPHEPDCAVYAGAGNGGYSRAKIPAQGDEGRATFDAVVPGVGRSVANETAPLKAGARRMLMAAAGLDPMPLTRSQIGTLGKIKPTSGTFSNYLGALKVAGYLVERDGKLTVTDAGFEFLGGRPAAPMTADELREMWQDRLKAGARRMLDVLIAAYPVAITRAELAGRAEVSPSSGTFSNYLGMLRSAGLLEESDGDVKANDVLFLGPRA